MRFVLLLLALGILGLLGSVASSRGIGSGGGPDLRTTYYANGQVEAECRIVDGRREGPYRRFHPGGQLAEEGLYVAARREGAWRFFEPDGTLDASRSGLYRSGKRVAE